jgi:hypothetical protein
LEKRNPLIAALFGGSQNTGVIPLWKHDVIVVTAGKMNASLAIFWYINCVERMVKNGNSIA